MTPFHLALNVHDLDAARAFYGGVLGCREGRSAPTWVDFDFYGHQLSLHLGAPFATADTGLVAGRAVPMPHFGVVLELPAWQALAGRLRAAGTASCSSPACAMPASRASSGRCSSATPRAIRSRSRASARWRASTRPEAAQPASGRTVCSIAPNTLCPSAPCISMRMVSPWRMKGVCGAPPSIVSMARFSAMQL